MRRITYNFESGPQFLRHLERSTSISDRALRLVFLANFPISIGEIIRFTLVIDATGERHDLHLRICERDPTLPNVNCDSRWSYRAVATDSDAPWLHMLAKKYDTAQRLSV